jgi:hypothetical protein
MDYDQFDVEYDRVWEGMKAGFRGAGLRGAELAAEVERLRGLADSIENERDRRDAHLDIDIILDVTRPRPEEPRSETLLEIWRVDREASSFDGTTAERIARLERGIAELHQIAERATPEEMRELSAHSHSLHMLLSALRPDVT